MLQKSCNLSEQLQNQDVLNQIIWKNTELCMSATPAVTDTHYNIPHQVIHTKICQSGKVSERTQLQTMLLTPSSLRYLKYSFCTQPGTGALLWFSLQGRDAKPLEA